MDHEKLYLEDVESFSEDPSVQEEYGAIWQEQWGVYPHKPAAQVKWDSQVEKAALHIARIDKVEANKAAADDERPHVYDFTTKSWYLVDSGAAVSIVPRKWFPRTTPDTGRALQAVNGTRIATYGVKNLTLRFGDEK